MCQSRRRILILCREDGLISNVYEEFVCADCAECIVASDTRYADCSQPLWDGSKEVKLVATNGRKARAGSTANGSYAEMIAYGVEYMSDLVDISICIDVSKRTREAVVTARELNGKKVMFLTGVNFHEGQTIAVLTGPEDGKYDAYHIKAFFKD